MLAPANPPRVASKVAPVTRVWVLAARGMLPAAMPIPLRVVRYDSAPEPRMEGPAPVIVMFDIVPAMALRSPAFEGAMLPLTPSSHFSDDPGSSVVGLTGLLART